MNNFTNQGRAFIPIDVDAEQIEVISAIDVMTRNQLAKQYNVMMPFDLQVTTIAYTYIEQLLKYMKKTMDATGNPGANVNFMDMLEFTIDYRNNPDAEKEGNLNLMVVPGANAKLAIKSDALTEDN